MERILRTIPIGGRGITDIGTDTAVATGSFADDELQDAESFHSG
jgi:hypothetical protein